MQKGFTLTELLVVIVLMGVVGGIATMSILTSLEKGKNETNMMMENNLADVKIQQKRLDLILQLQYLMVQTKWILWTLWILRMIM